MTCRGLSNEKSSLTFFLGRLAVSPETTGFPFCRLLRLIGITVEVFLPASTRGLSDERTGLQFVVQSVSGQSRRGLISIHYCLVWDHWVPFTSPLTTRRDHGGSILTRLHTGTLWREDGSAICSPICQRSESQRTHIHTLLSRLRLLGSLYVTSYDSQGLRWKYSYLPAHGVDTEETRTEHTQTSIPLVGFEPTISVLEQAKTVCALDRTATAIGIYHTKITFSRIWSFCGCGYENVCLQACNG
jgi:hypothetical protein